MGSPEQPEFWEDISEDIADNVTLNPDTPEKLRNNYRLLSLVGPIAEIDNRSSTDRILDGYLEGETILVRRPNGTIEELRKEQ